MVRSMKDAITAVLVSYINDFGPQDAEVLVNAVNMPVDFLTDYLFDLVERRVLLFDQESYRFSLGEESKMYVIDMQENNQTEVALQPYGGKERFPKIETYETLDSYLQLKHINPTAYHVFRVNGKKRIKLDTNRPTKKYRDIASPSIELKKRQRWILDNILVRYQLPDCVHGFVKNRSILTNARCHVNQEEIGCIDIKDFFPSIDYKKVQDVYLNMGYPIKIADALAILTTLNGRLPQGAPTSPMLSNIVMKPLDLLLMKYAEEHGLVYSRYADDITVSGKHGISEHVKQIVKMIEDFGFSVNKKKTHIMNSSSGKKVTGLSVGSSIKVPLEYKRKLRQEMYYCKKYGVSYHLGHSQDKDPRYVNFSGYLYGKAYFVKMVEPEVGDEYLKQLDTIFGYE